MIDIVSISDGEEDDGDGGDMRSHKYAPGTIGITPSSDTQVLDLTGEDDQSHPVGVSDPHLYVDSVLCSTNRNPLPRRIPRRHHCQLAL